MNKRQFLQRTLAGVSAMALAGCDRLSMSPWFSKVLSLGETLNQGVHQWVGGRTSMAQEFAASDISPTFRGNGSINPGDAPYRAMVANGFASWTLTVDGLVEQPAVLTLAQLRAMPSRTQITRHDCVEGWSAIGKWTGVPLAQVLALAKPKAQARYVVFHCADTYGRGSSKTPYYESIDMLDAYHAQTILAYDLNGKPVPIANGAPLRLRVERQLGYKHAKFVTRLELVESFSNIGRGKGGYWEDRGYQWYAGI
ncbi:MAG TPA: molybdopterin-binding protein [Burkholderiales bacterium]|nr:molybdopterin-binding protein [Burkholderiales bacterium]